MEYQRELEDAIEPEALRTEREMWREHALICEVLLRDNGHEVPVDVARTSLAGEIRVDARGNLLDKDLRVLRCLPDVRWLVRVARLGSRAYRVGKSSSLFRQSQTIVRYTSNTLAAHESQYGTTRSLLLMVVEYMSDSPPAERTKSILGLS